MIAIYSHVSRTTELVKLFTSADDILIKMIRDLTKFANVMHLTRRNSKYQKGVTFLAHPVNKSHSRIGLKFGSAKLQPKDSARQPNIWYYSALPFFHLQRHI